VARKPKHPVTEYAEKVVKGKILAGELTKLACERHLRDLKTCKSRGLYFDEEAADHAIEFFQFLKHSKGEWAGCTFELELWQKFIVGSLFGWMRKDGTRRFRTGLIEVPRKNGKSTLIAGIGLYLFVADGEPGAEIYSAATKRDQARIVWTEAAKMVKASPDLAARIRVYPGKGNMHIEATGAKFEPLGADADTMDGLNVHGALIDELHAHKNREVWDVLETATGARRQPLQIAITTAGFDQHGIGYEQHEYGTKILKRTIKDDTYFVYIACMDDDDDWTSVTTWKKANPNFGISVKEDDLKRKCEKAKEIPAAQNNFLCKHLNKWTQQATRWIDLGIWDENASIVVEEELRGRTCYGGLDLSSVNDITAWVMVFPDDDDIETVDVLCRFFCPEARLYDPRNKYKDQYQAWAKQGFLTPTPGEVVDYAFVREQIIRDAETFDLVDMNIDRLFNSHQIAGELMDAGIKVIGMVQGHLSYAVPMKEFERRLLSRKIRHGGNPVLRWMADNVAVREDPAGNLKPDKANSQGKIDGIVALVMALDRAIRHQDVSIYETQGIFVV